MILVESCVEYQQTTRAKSPKRQVGCCFLQQGEARYDWLHGVPKLSQGERLSVTWRWFLDDVELR